MPKSLSTPERLTRYIVAAEEAGKTVLAARIEGRAVDLKFADEKTHESGNPADLVTP